MSPLAILDQITLPGAPARANEDRFGHGDGFAFVIDGATGLGETRLVASHGSDAAWLASAAAGELQARLRGATPINDIVRGFNEAARRSLSDALGGEAALRSVPRYALPTAGFQCLRVLEGGAVETSGLADCSFIALGADGVVHRATGQAKPRGDEQEAARRAIEAFGGLQGDGVARRSPEVMQGLRDARDKHNLPGAAIWTLGTMPEAADQVVSSIITLARPALILLATDGFADLIDNYRRYSGETLLRAIERQGLKSLSEELRRIERVEDPQGLQFPRFKRSDDATAIFMRLS